MKRKWAFSILSVLLLIIMGACSGSQIICKSSADFGSPANAGGAITVAWDSNTDPNLGGYRVFYGTSPGKYKNCVDVGKGIESLPGVVKYTLTGLVKGKRYYLSAIAYSTYDISITMSGFSNEVSAVAK